MAKFIVALQCIMTAEVEIDHESITSLEEAKKLVEEVASSPSSSLVYGFPTSASSIGKLIIGKWEFLDDSVEVNDDMTSELNPVPSNVPGHEGG